MQNVLKIPDYIRALVNSRDLHTLVINPPKFEKTAPVLKALKNLKLEFILIPTGSTPLDLYNAICLHPESIFVIEDAAVLLADLNSRTFIKAATRPSFGENGERRLRWKGPSGLTDQASVIFGGKIILVGEIPPDSLTAGMSHFSENFESLNDEALPDWLRDDLPTSVVAERSGITAVLHQTKNLETLQAILREGCLKKTENPEEMTQGGQRAIYFYLHRGAGHTSQGKEAFDRLSKDKPVLKFDLSLLDLENYHINRHWNYGAASKDSFHCDDPHRLHRYLVFFGAKNQALSADIPEVVFEQNNLSLKALRAIYVVRGAKAGLIAELDTRWHDFVVEMSD